MKQLVLLSLICVLLSGCKNDSKQESHKPINPAKPTAQLIAEAHGYNSWNNVSSITFTFGVDRDSIKGNGRTWTWMPKQDSVYLNTGEQVLKYCRKSIDSLSINADRAFINDKFWLLAPFQLVWDSKADITEPIEGLAPISGSNMNMITITYPSEGGYTPGDAYDIYFDTNYIIREWVFRRGNDDKPSLVTTFEDYSNFKGLKIATSHKMAEGNWNLKFRDVKVSLK